MKQADVLDPGEATNPALTRFEAALSAFDLDEAVAAELLRAFRSARSAAGSSSRLVSVIGGAMGPLFVAFVAWTLERARAEGFNRLYFVARDGQILHNIARELTDGDGPELAYLYGSRQAWYLPSVREVTREGLPFVMNSANSMAPADNLPKLGLTLEEAGAALESAGLPPSLWETQLTAEQSEAFWAAILSPPVGEKIEANARVARRLALDYFDQEGLLADDRWALVDIGWGLSAQASLRSIIADHQPHTMGYYLAIGQARTPPEAHGRAEGLLVEERDYGLRYPGRATVFDNKGIVDQLFTLADHGRTLGYRRNGDHVEPILDQAEADADLAELRRLIQSTMVGLARELASGGLPTKRVDALTAVAPSLADMFLSGPERAEVAEIAWFPVVYDQYDAEARMVPLARPITVGMVWTIGRAVVGRLLKGGRLSSSSSATPTALVKDLTWGFSWLDGSAALSRWPSRMAVRLFQSLNRMWARRRNRT